MMSGMISFNAALIAVLIFGLAEALATGTIQVYAMDLAPEDKRGAFLGVWALSQSAGQIVGPLIIGLIADTVSFQASFLVVVAILVVGIGMVLVFGTETHRRGRPEASK
jgi:MFS family permease